MDSELKNNLRRHLQKSCSVEELKRWYDPLRLTMDEDRGEVAVVFPHAFFATWFSGDVQERFEKDLHEFLGGGFALRYGTNGSGGRNGNESAENGAEEVRSIDFPFGQEFTFTSFIENKKNFFPLKSAREVAKQSDILFNPFVISGPGGSGKTHLVKAIANDMARRSGRETVYFGSLEELVDLYEGTYAGDYFKARTFVCSHRALIIDDFQLIRRHQDFQAELISLFDTFYGDKRQMIFCCADSLPSYEFLDQKLKSRLEWGLIVSLMEPDLEVRLGCVERFCNQKQVTLSRDRMLTLAQRFSDLRFLQGVLLKLYAYKELVNTDFSDRDFDRILAQTTGVTRCDVSPENIIDIVAAFYGLESKDLKGLRRHHNVVRARQAAMYLCRDILGTSYPALGRLFGGRDHSTALYAVKKVRRAVATDVAAKDQIEALRKRCLSGE